MTSPDRIEDLSAVVDRFAEARVLVVGDALLDVWVHGSARRLCREGPVPVVDVARVERAAGGAANTAVNAAALGGRVHLLAATGSDAEAADLRAVLEQQGVDAGDLLATPSRATTTKHRVVCDGLLVARYDVGTGRWPQEVVDALVARCLELVDEVDAVVVSDYGSGLVSGALRQRLAAERTRIRGPLVVDAHDVSPWAEVRPTVVTPNVAESLRLLGVEALDDGDRIRALADASDALLRNADADLVITTMDGDGSLLHRPGRPAHRTYALGTGADHPCGAGDTYVAALALALATGADPRTAAVLAQRAADVVVTRPGTAVCSAQDLLWRCADAQRTAAVPLDELAVLVAAHRAGGRRIVFTNGCFDILHAGHAASLEEARRLGDVLVVGVNSDRSVRRLKGPDRPIVGEEERARLVGALAPVDHVVLFDDDSPRAVIEAIRPDVYAKGGDYTVDMLPEADVVRRVGGEIRLLGYVADRSTTGIVERIRRLA